MEKIEDKSKSEAENKVVPLKILCGIEEGRGKDEVFTFSVKDEKWISNSVKGNFTEPEKPVLVKIWDKS